MLASGTQVRGFELSGFGCLGVCMLASGIIPKIAGSLPTEAVGFFLLEKSTACRPSSNTRTIQEQQSTRYEQIFKKTRPKPSDFSGRKNPQHAFVRRGSKAVGPVSQIFGM
jgi:hypothetical protein